MRCRHSHHGAKAYWNSSARGFPAAEICRDYYPDLTTDDIRACVQYAIDLIALENIRLAETV